MAERVEVMLSEEEVDRRIQEIGEQISKDYAGKQVHLVCVLKGGSFFLCELAKRITVPVSLDFMSVSSYGGDTKSSGVIKIVKDLDEPLRDKNVIVVEDIVDSGRTLSYLLDMLKARGPKSMALCTLLDKPDRRVIDVKVDYTGFQIPDEFVVGYGLDYDQRYRNLPYIGVVKFDRRRLLAEGGCSEQKRQRNESRHFPFAYCAPGFLVFGNTAQHGGYLYTGGIQSDAGCRRNIGSCSSAEPGSADRFRGGTSYLGRRKGAGGIGCQSGAGGAGNGRSQDDREGCARR